MEATRREVQLENARRRYPTDDLSAALADLRRNFGSFLDFPIEDDAANRPREFDVSHPDRPHAARHREVRQSAASFFWLLAEGDSSLVTEEALDALHQALFDCSAAVRHDVAMALGHVNDPASAPYLQRLIETEPASEMVREAAEWAHSGDKSRRYGSAVVTSSGPAHLREPNQSEFARDPAPVAGVSAEQVFYLLWAACFPGK